MAVKLSSANEGKVLDNQETNIEVNDTQEDTDNPNYTTLYLASAYGIRYEEFPGIDFFWGERTSQTDNKTVLEGALARFTINHFNDLGATEIHVRPNKGLVVIEEHQGYHYFKEIVSYSDWQLILLDIRKGLALFFDGPQVDLRIDARGVLLNSQGYHKYVLGSRIERFPYSVRVKKKSIEDLVEIACHLGGNISGNLHKELPAEINKIYDTFLKLGDGLKEYKLHNKSIFPEFKLHEVGTLNYDEYRLHDLDTADTIPKKNPELFGNFEELVNRLQTLKGYELKNEGNGTFYLYYRGRGSNKKVLSFKPTNGYPPVTPCSVPLREVPIIFFQREGKNIDVKKGLGMYKDEGRHSKVLDIVYTFGCY